jgi:hypothetical protein
MVMSWSFDRASCRDASLAVLLGCTGWLTGCCWGVTCAECDFPIVLTATDAETSEFIDRSDLTCRDASNPTRRCNTLSEPGEYRIVISGEGYESAERTVVVGESDGGCCDCGYDTAYVEVALEPI